MTTRDILKAESLSELLITIDDFCKKAIVMDNDDVYMELKKDSIEQTKIIIL